VLPEIFTDVEKQPKSAGDINFIKELFFKESYLTIIKSAGNR